MFPTLLLQLEYTNISTRTLFYVFQNMVGPGEVDEELEPETAEECSKYGKVIKCVIYEVKKYVTFILGT